MGRVICLNGRFVTLEQACISVMDKGFLYGFGLFETMLIREGAPMFIDRHLRRLLDSARVLGIRAPFEAGELGDLVIETIKRNSVRDGSLRLTLSAGAAWAAAGELDIPSSVVIFVRKPLPYTSSHYARGFRAGFASARRDERSPLVRLKTLNCLDNVLAKREALRKGQDEALFLNVSGRLAEGATTNIFLVKDGRLVTPALDQGLLPGITREVIIEKCAQVGISVEEREVFPDEIWEADECFLTNSLMGVMPLVEVEGRLIGKGFPGPMTSELGRLLFALP